MNSIARRRLASQHLVAPTLRRAADVVRLLGAVQAQDYSGAKWAIGQRTKGVTDAEIDRAFARGDILRTHVLRPTWHFVLPEDARWMLELTAPRVRGFMAFHSRWLGLDTPVFRKSHAALERALRDGHQLTRTELREALIRARLKVPTGQHMGGLLMQAELDRVVISGARRGKQFTYALFDERVPARPPRERDEALDELTRRYFATRSPATALDFAWWSGLAVRDVKRGIDIAGLTREVHDEREFWAARGAGRSRSRRARRTAHLLPNYDEYFIGFKDRSAIAQRLGGVVTKRQISALMGHVLFVDGQIVGGWRGRRAGDAAELRLQMLVRLTAPERALVRRAVRGFEEFLEVPVRVDGSSHGPSGRLPRS